MAKPKSRRLRFTRIHLENWRNFTHVDVELEQRVFIVGANALGKSNLLDVFRFLHDIVAAGGGFKEATRRRGGVSSLRCLAARRKANISISISIGTDDNRDAWGYQLSFGQDNRRQPIITREKVSRNGRVILERPDGKDKSDTKRLTQTYIEQVHANQAFRDIVDFFASVRHFHIVPQLIRDPYRSATREGYPLGTVNFLEQIASTPERTRTARLSRIGAALRVTVPQLKKLEFYRDARGTPHLRGQYEHWQAQRGWQTESQFSDGTLRLLGLLWAVLDGTGPLLLEEPELSIHPEVVRFIPQMFARIQRRSNRQLVISTHSSDLLYDEGIGLDEVLLLRPEAEGTSVSPASGFKDIMFLLEGGLTLADALMPRTRPDNVEQLMLFGE